MKLFVPFVALLSFSNLGWAKDRILVIEQIRGGLNYKAELLFPAEKGQLTNIQLKGFSEDWNCDVWGPEEKNEAHLTCYAPEKYKALWKIQSTISCDSKDSFFIDAVTVKCQ